MARRSILLAIGIIGMIGLALPDSASIENNITLVGAPLAGIVREVTAYNVGVREQTSATPCIGAGGIDLCKLVRRGMKVCAANFVDLGTILRIEEYGECVVLDRINRRYGHRVDIAMQEDEVDEALEFGLQRRFVEVAYR